MLKIGSKMRHLRTERGLTHRQLADAVGVAEGTISRIERNQREPSAETMAKIADYLGVTMDDLRDEVPNAATPSQIEARLIDAAQRAQGGDRAALQEMRRILQALAEAEEGASVSRATERKKKAPSSKGT